MTFSSTTPFCFADTMGKEPEKRVAEATPEVMLSCRSSMCFSFPFRLFPPHRFPHGGTHGKRPHAHAAEVDEGSVDLYLPISEHPPDDLERAGGHPLVDEEVLSRESLLERTAWALVGLWDSSSIIPR